MYFPDYGKLLSATTNLNKKASLEALDPKNAGAWISDQMKMIKFRLTHQDKEDENKVFFYIIFF